MKNVDSSGKGFITFMFIMLILVVVVVGTSQYQQFQLSDTAVQQNTDLLKLNREMADESVRTHQAVNSTVKQLLDFEKAFKNNSITLLNNISKAHDVLINFVNHNSLNSLQQMKLLESLDDNQSAELIHKLDAHNTTTYNAFKNTQKNNAILSENNRLIHQVMDILGNRTALVTPTK